MKLTGEQREQIHEAILSGYDEPDLEQLVQFSLEQPLDHIARGRTLPQVVHALVNWAERNDRLEDLVGAAYKRSLDNPEIQQLWRDYSQWRAASTGNEVRENRVSQMGIERGATPLWHRARRDSPVAKASAIGCTGRFASWCATGGLLLFE